MQARFQVRSAGLVLALLAVAAPVASAQGTFAGRQWHFPGSATSLVTGDANLDGRPDLIFGKRSPEQVGFFPSTGRGMFGSAVVSSIGFVPEGVAAGDFNSDGRLDIAATGNQSIAIVLGGPGGTLGAPSLIPLTGWGFGLSCADANLDGKLDLLIANLSRHAVSILPGLGNGTFGAAVDWPVPPATQPRCVALAQLNADAFPDLVVGLAGSVGGIAVMLGNAVGSFDAAQVQLLGAGDQAKALALADLDGDGDLDAALAMTDSAGVFWNNGLGLLTTNGTFAVPFYCYGVGVADLDANGWPDLVLSSTSSGGFQVRLGTGNGNFQPAVTHPGGSNVGLLALSDLDGDGAIDVAIGDYGINTLLGDGAGGFIEPGIVPASWARPLAAGDMNGDGIDDIVTSATDTGGMANCAAVRLGDGQGGFAPPSKRLLGGELSSVAVGRMNADAALDVVATTTLVNNQGQLAIFAGNGAGGIALSSVVPTGGSPTDVAVGDLNGDSFADAAVCFGLTGPYGIALHFGDGLGGMASAIVLATPGRPYSVRAADLDGDLDIDLAATCTCGTALVFLNDGNGVFTPAHAGVGSSTVGLDIGDLNGDGIPDLVLGGSGALHYLRGLGGANFAPPVTSAVNVNAPEVRVADFTGDGRQDVLTIYQGDPISLFPGDGLGGLGAPEEFMSVFFNLDVVALHADSDGRLDAVTSVGNQSHASLVVHFSRDGTIEPVTYCAAKLNSLGCLPAMDWAGTSSASATSGFVVRANNVRNQKSGLLLYSVTGRANLPFSGGLLCVRAPIRRSPGLFSGGSTSGNDCTGVYSLDMNAFAAGTLGGTPLPALRTPGVSVTCEFWGRDPGFPAPNNTTLTGGLEYFVGR